MLVASVLMYRWQRGSWTAFFVLFLVPDLSMLGYLAGPAFGARLYNLTHNYVAPLFLACYSLSVGRQDIVPYALIWMAHLGFDRMAGMGLKYPSAFRDTHLGRIGKS